MEQVVEEVERIENTGTSGSGSGESGGMVIDESSVRGGREMLEARGTQGRLGERESRRRNVMGEEAVGRKKEGEILGERSLGERDSLRELSLATREVLGEELGEGLGESLGESVNEAEDVEARRDLRWLADVAIRGRLAFWLWRK